MKPPLRFFLAGPTAVGKSALAAELAGLLNAEIVGADAFQIYDGLGILTAKPPAAVLAKARHHLIGEVPLDREFDVAQYLELAAGRMREIEARGKRVLVAGGTGLYLRALTHGLAPLPQADRALRSELENLPLPELAARLAKLDPASASAVDLQNPRRVIRAIEVCMLTGQPFSRFQSEWKQRPQNTAGILLTRDREELRARIAVRTAEMFAEGVAEEVRRAGNLSRSAAQVIGFRDVQAHLRGEISQAEAAARITRATQRYAKRQLTWFRRDPTFEPLPLSAFPSPESAAESAARTLLAAAARAQQDV